MTAFDIAKRLLEADEDFDPTSEIGRYITSEIPGIEIESEYNHWGVYRKIPEGRFRLGNIYYEDMEDAPVEQMPPEARTFWEGHRWTAVPSGTAEPTFHKDFHEAVLALVPPGYRPRPVKEGEEDEDIEGTIERAASAAIQPVGMEVTSANGRRWYIRIVWDKPAGGTTYDAEGRVVQEKLQPTVEFFDITREHKQFVSGYYAATLVDRQPHTGLDLMGHEPVWKIDGHTMDRVIDWIKSEVEKRGYRLADDEAGGISFGKRYESADDPDDPDLYTHPDRYTQQPSDEKIEGALRRMLAPYYTRISINKRPGMFAGREMVQHDIPDQPGVVNRLPFADSLVWTIHCNRETPLPLPPTRPYVGHRGTDPNSWRKQVKSWFERWASESGLHLFRFEIYGRLRKDPTFQFETARLGPLKENEEDLTPEDYVSHIVDTGEASHDLNAALWKFHPYGVGYNSLLSYKGGFVTAQTYFPPEKDNFIRRFEDFVLNWVKEHNIMTVTHHKLTAWKQKGPPQYPRWGIMLALNSDWPPDEPAYTAPPVEVGEPGVLPGGGDAP